MRVKGVIVRVYVSAMLLFICSIMMSNASAENVRDSRIQFVDISFLEHAYFPKNSVKEKNTVNVSDVHREYAKNKYRIKLEQRRYNVVLAKDVNHERILAGLITIEIPYKDTLALLAVVLSHELRVQRAVVIEVDKKYMRPLHDEAFRTHSAMPFIFF